MVMGLWALGLVIMVIFWMLGLSLCATKGHTPGTQPTAHIFKYEIIGSQKNNI